MRGKKSDPEFVSNFISECVKQGITTPETMVKVAKDQIQAIDDKIKEVELLKVTRSKLLDVVITFDKPENKFNDVKILSFFELEYPQVCLKICRHLSTIHPSSPYSTKGIKDPEILFCIKQLMGHKIINRILDKIVPGERFDEYLKFVLHEKT